MHTSLATLALFLGASSASNSEIARQIAKEIQRNKEIATELGYDTPVYSKPEKIPAHPMVQADTSSSVSNKLTPKSTIWQGLNSPIYMGSANEEVLVNLDSTKDWLRVKTNACANCNTYKYDASASSSNSIVDSTVKEDLIDGTNLKGKLSKDKVSLKSDGTTFVNDFSYFAIEGWDGLTKAADDTSNYDGVLGLGRQVQTSEKKDKQLYGPLLLESLKTNSQITNEIWGLRYDDDAKSVNYGQVDTAMAKTGASIKYIEQKKESILWEAEKVSAVKLGNEDQISYSGLTAAYTYGEESHRAVFATGNNFIFAPHALAYDLNVRITKEKSFDWDPVTELFQVDCNDISAYPSISLYVDDNWITMDNKDYILNYGDFCALAILPNNEGDFWMFGAPFYQGYYTVFDNSDHTKAKIGFAPSASSKKGELTTGGLPQETIKDVRWELTWLWDWYDVLSFDGWLPVDWLYGGVGTLWIEWFGFNEEFYK